MLSRDVYLRCCLCVCALLHVPAASISNTSTKDQLPTGVEDQEHTGGDSPLLWLRDSLPSYSQPLRPYALLTNAEDYIYMPKPRHYRPSRLLRILGSSFDPFWMSIGPPSGSSGVSTDKGSCNALSRGDSLPVKLPNDTTSREDVNVSASAVLRKAAASQRKKLEREAADVDLSTLPPDVATSVRASLVHSATCGLCSQWVDLGPAFWPRWLRQTDCDKSDRVQSCSFPTGMVCVRAQIAHIKILAWHCLKIREDESKRFKTDRSDVSMLMGTSEELRRCLWMVVPYPVVTACRCSCQ
ncbi:noggin-like [Dunckerocampus dactyliophorus]|uniref:noggin-like n=1 Tax=Dunckerocampus dactyliophorus TaxID=161453 RepID=UPI0024059E35|nr:noggin-like [Dunckerocampus dactyliophorus]